VVENLQFFGGRGASSGLSDKGKKYGSEYKTLYQTGNIKFVITMDQLQHQWKP